MKKGLLTLCFCALAGVSAVAAPAKKGIWKQLKLQDGTTLMVELQGDEFLSYWQDANGNRYVQQDDYIVPANFPALKQAAVQLRTQAGATVNDARRAMAKRRSINNYEGNKRCLIILVQFSDQSFSMSDPKAFYNRVANEKNFSEGSFRGSVSDYFSAQSLGKLNITFDVVGPYTLGTVASYGKDENYNGQRYDTNPAGMISAACGKAASDGVDFSQYDWDGDGQVEEVYVIYAGPGENNTSNSDLIWPHMFYLSSSDYGQAAYVNGIYVDTYACSCELNGYGTADGMGTICHEFSHCLGYPDLYDTTYSGSYGMDAWDLLHQGCYNGNGFSPANLTGYERWMAGWITPVELKTDTVVTDMKSLTDYGETYIIYNEQNKNEFYFVDNRQRTGWDESIPGNGLLITHVDYNKKAWHSNSVNNDPTHERMTPFHADGWNNRTGSSMRTADGDPYPYQNNDRHTLQRQRGRTPVYEQGHARHEAQRRRHNVVPFPRYAGRIQP